MREEVFNNNFYIMTITIAAVVGMSLSVAIYFGLKTFNITLPTYAFLALFLMLSAANFAKDYIKQGLKIKKTVTQWQKDEDCEII